MPLTIHSGRLAFTGDEHQGSFCDPVNLLTIPELRRAKEILSEALLAVDAQILRRAVDAAPDAKKILFVADRLEGWAETAERRYRDGNDVAQKNIHANYMDLVTTLREAVQGCPPPSTPEAPCLACRLDVAVDGLLCVPCRQYALDKGAIKI